MTARRFLASCTLLLFTLLLLPSQAALRAAEPGKLYVVGMGPAGPDLTAPRALAVIEKADVLLCSPRMPQRFAAFGTHIDPRKVAFDPWEKILGNEVRDLKKKDPTLWAKERDARIEEVQGFILERLKEGKTVALLDGGDPCVYGPSLQYLLQGFDDARFEVIPGMGAFNAAGAALKRSLTPENARFVFLTSPESLFGESWEKDDGILKDLAKYETTMILYMSLKTLDRIAERLSRYYPADLPIAIVYYAGYSGKETVLRTRLGSLLKDVKAMDENWLGLFVAGACAK